MSHHRYVSTLALCLVLIATWTGCGGGGDGSPSTGSVAVLLADAPTDDFDHIFVRIAEISLLPADDGAPVVVHREDGDIPEIDLLDLREEDLLLLVKHDVPVGTFNKIRLRIASIRVEGGPCADMRLVLPSGKIDLNPRGPFEVLANQTVSVRIDVDVEKSLHLNVAGQSGKCVFRPVVFVEIVPGRPLGRCLRSVAGTIGDLVDEDGATTGFFLGLAHSGHEVEVVLRNDTSLFDLDGRPATPEILATGQSVHVKGRLDDAGKLQADLVVLGQVLVLKGRVDGPVVAGSFPFVPDPGEEVTGPLTVQLDPATIVFLGCDRAPDSGVIQPGMRARIVGKLSPTDSTLLAALVAVRPQAIQGEVVAVTGVEGGVELTLRTEGPDGEVRVITVFLPDGVAVRLGNEGELPIGLLEALVLCESRPVRLELDSDDPSRVISAHLDVERLVTRLLAADMGSGSLSLDGLAAHAMENVMVVDLRSESSRLGSLDDVPMGGEITVMGVRGCPDRDIEFQVLVILIFPA